MNNFGISVFDGTMLTAAPSQGVDVSITGPVTWNGMTDLNGYAKDAGGFSPTLPYGNYTVIASKYGYNQAVQNFSVPLAGNVNLTITRIYQTVEIIVNE